MYYVQILKTSHLPLKPTLALKWMPILILQYINYRYKYVKNVAATVACAHKHCVSSINWPLLFKDIQ